MSRRTEFIGWACHCFGPAALTVLERATRLFEEAVELAQAAGVSKNMVLKIVERVYKKPAGPIHKEAAQVSLLLEAFLLSAGLPDQEDLMDEEWERVQTIPISEWRRRHGAKAAEGIADNPMPQESP